MSGDATMRVGKYAIVFVQPLLDDGNEHLLALVLAQASAAIRYSESSGFWASLDEITFIAQLRDERIEYEIRKVRS